MKPHQLTALIAISIPIALFVSFALNSYADRLIAERLAKEATTQQEQQHGK